jgi:glycosyltransferase involved in cell wall biosynthesis
MTTVAPACELTILMPCLNEAETLATCIRKARGFLERAGIPGEVVVADNGSTDGSQDIARQSGARVVDVAMRGYGAALYHGAMAARGRFIVMGDADDSYDFTNLDGFVERLRDGYDLVMGNRFAGGIAPGAMPWKNRYVGNPALTAIGRLFFNSPAHDFHCGLRGISADAFRRLDLRTTGMEYASEMVIKATLAGMRIAETPTTLSPAGRSRPPHLRPWRDGWRHLRFMLLYSPRWLFVIPGLATMVAGLVAVGLLMRGPLRVGEVTFDLNTMVFSSVAVLLGFTAFSFGVFTKIFAIGEGLLPPDPRLSAAFRFVTLEVGLTIGSMLMAGGAIGAVVTVVSWQRSGFAAFEIMRWVIPSALAVALGFQIVLSSFFLSVLGLRTRTYTVT